MSCADTIHYTHNTLHTHRTHTRTHTTLHTACVPLSSLAFVLHWHYRVPLACAYLNGAQVCRPCLHSLHVALAATDIAHVRPGDIVQHALEERRKAKKGHARENVRLARQTRGTWLLLGEMGDAASRVHVIHWQWLSWPRPFYCAASCRREASQRRHRTVWWTAGQAPSQHCYDSGGALRTGRGRCKCAHGGGNGQLAH